MAQDATEAMGELMNAVGGVPEGLIATANAYIAADASSTPGNGSNWQKLPVPGYGATRFPRPDQSSANGYMDIETVERNPAWVSLQQLNNPFQLLMDFFPRGHQDLLTTARDAWQAISARVDDLSQDLNTVLDSLTVNQNATTTPRGGSFPGRLTQQQVGGWRKAMVSYCNAIRGASEFGSQGLPAHPPGLIGKCADELAALCDKHIAAINTTRSKIEHRLADGAGVVILGAILSETADRELRARHRHRPHRGYERQQHGGQRARRPDHLEVQPEPQPALLRDDLLPDELSSPPLRWSGPESVR
jgi:hypothetical protein